MRIYICGNCTTTIEISKDNPVCSKCGWSPRTSQGASVNFSNLNDDKYLTGEKRAPWLQGARRGWSGF